MSSHSLIGANRNTHLKITAVALVGAILLVVVGMIARTDDSGTVTAQVHGPEVGHLPSQKLPLAQGANVLVRGDLQRALDPLPNLGPICLRISFEKGPVELRELRSRDQREQHHQALPVREVKRSPPSLPDPA